MTFWYNIIMERNNTGNDSSSGTFPSSLSDVVESEAASFKIAKIFFYFLILSASTFGNSMVAHVIGTTRKMHTPSNFLILNLAICDLLTPIISIVFDFVLEENNYAWCYGEFMCKLLWPAQTFFTCASSLTLAVISLDRYRLIMHPFKTRLSLKQICILICLVHVFSLAAVSPYVYVLDLKNGSCDENWPEFSYRQGYTFFLFLVQYGLPLCFMATMYGLAARALYRTSAKMRDNSINENIIQVGRSESTDTKVKSTRKISRAQSVKRKISTFSARIDIWTSANAKATKMFIVVVVVFAIFMFPNQVVWLWADFGGGIKSPNFTKVSIICWLFTYTNCVVNPIIFGIFSKDFRQGFRGIFDCFVCCSDKSPPQASGEKERLQTVSES